MKTKLSIIRYFFRAGNICTYVSNQRMSVAVDTIETTVRNNLDDVDTYLNLIQKVHLLISVAIFATDLNKESKAVAKPNRICTEVRCADPEGEQGVQTPPPLKSHKNIGFCSRTGPNFLEKHEASEPELNVVPSSARQRHTI